MTSGSRPFEKALRERFDARKEAVRGIGAKVVLELTGEHGGKWLVDATQSPASLVEDAGAEAETTISMAVTDFEKMVAGELKPETAFLTGKVKVKGNLGAAIKLGQLIM